MSYLMHRRKAFRGGDYLFDDYGQGIDGLSVRKLQASAITNCMEIERTSDNTKLDIGWSGDDIDESAISTFCSGTTGRVRTWYNQGTHDDFQQTTHSLQPIAYESAALIKVNGKLAPKHAGSTGEELIQSTTYSGNDKRKASTYEVLVAGVIFQLGSNARNGPYGVDSSIDGLGILATYDGTIYFDCGDSDASERSSVAQPTGWDDSQVLLVCYSDASDSFIRVDASQLKTEAYTPNSHTTARTYHLFDYNNFEFGGNIQEIAVWADDKVSDLASIESNINAFYSIY